MGEALLVGDGIADGAELVNPSWKPLVIGRS